MSDKTKIKITSIVCNGTSESPWNDEVYLIYQADAGIPVRYPVTSYQRMNTSADSSQDVVKTWNISDLEIEFENEVLITLWDQDVKGVNTWSTFLINHDYTKDSIPASASMSNHNGANYTINAAKVS